MVINFLLLLLYLLNIKQSLGLTIQNVDPLYLQIQEDGGEQAVILTFNESVENDNSELILSYDDGKVNWEYTLPRSRPPKGENYPNRAYFYINHDDFYIKKLFGYYKLYYGEQRITTETQILIYLNSIGFKNPRDRYILMGDGSVNCTFELVDSIMKEEIYRISLNDGQTISDNCTYYLDKDGISLIITLKNPNKEKTYILNVYPTYDKDINSPSTLNVFFQNFFVHNEAVYANASAESTKVKIRTDFKTDTYYGVNFILEYSGSGSVTFQDNGFSRDDNQKIIYSFTIFKPSPGIIRINYDNQVRPIFLITYETNSNKCYLSDTKQKFEIKFFKTSEMEYTHSVFFKATPNQGLQKGNENSDSPIYIGKLENLYPDTFYLYSRIPKLSSNDENPIDIDSLNVRIYENPNLEEDETTILYTKINLQQNLKFNMNGAGNVNEIFLISDKVSREINLHLNECEIINENIYNCNMTNYLMNLDESYISDDDYKVEYLSECDNYRLEINHKKVIIKKGFDLLSITPKWVFINDMDTTNIILKISDNIDEQFNIVYCIKGTIDKCFGKIGECVEKTVTHDLDGFPKKEEIYDVYLVINEQIVKNNKLIFKVVKSLDFIFNHQYFVKDNGAEVDKNYLLITKNFDEDDNNRINIIQDQFNKELTRINNKNFTYYIYNADYLGEINFKYFDNDIQSYIPIGKSIYIVNTIDELFSSYSSRECFYYKFKIEFVKRSNYNFNARIFLYNNNKELELENKGNNEYGLKSDDEKEINNLIGINNLYLYISEETIDRQIYLYRSKFALTKIEVPKYIIFPNNSLYFSSVTCDLCNAQNVLFEMSSPSNNYKVRLYQACQFSQNSMTINGYFNNIHNYFQYSMDGENIVDINNSQNLLTTFHSNQLNRASFTIDIDSKSSNTHLLIKINNTNKDFYCDLISNLTLYQIINGKNISLILDRASSVNEFKISNFEISFVIKKGNFDLDINHLARRRDQWETTVDSSFYHYFGNVTSYKIFEAYPTVFVSHDFPNKDLKINITFNNADLLDSFRADLGDVNDINSTTVECTLSKKDIQTSKKVQKKFSDYTIDIDLIYYNLSSPSKCVTLEQQENKYDLFIYVPDDYYNNKIYLKSNIYTIDYKQSDFKNGIITIPIDVVIKDNIKYDIYVDDKLTESFYLTDFGINFIPKFEFEKSVNNIILLPEKDQRITLTYFQNNQEGLSYSDYIKDISSFHIANICKTTDFDKNDNNDGIIINFDLSSLPTSQTNYYILSYIDKCGNQFNTGINIRILSFYFERHYFVLNNNNNNIQQGQNLRIQGPINNQIILHMVDGSGEDKIIYPNVNQNVYIQRFTESGTYSFYYINNNVRAELNDKVIVVNELSDLFDDKTNLSECMFYNTSRYLSFSYTFKIERVDNSFFNMTLKIDGDNQNYSLTKTNNDNIAYLLTYNNIQNRIMQNQTLLIYFYENNDMDQPLYKYNYKYTNITLNWQYEDVIYSDAKYIQFNMSCQISNNALQDFYLYKASSPNIKKGIIKCNNYLEKTDNIYVFNCILNENSISDNPIIASDFEYDYYIMKYDSEKVSLKEFYISKDVISSKFYLEHQEEIHTYQSTTLKINSSNNEFYIPYLNYLIFYNTSAAIKDSFIYIDFQNKFDNTNNYYEFQLFIGSKNDYYNLTNICRKPCNYCRKDNCKSLSTLIRDDYQIRSNIPDISLIFNRHYISLEDSLYKEEKNKTLIINFDGEDKHTLTQIKYQIYTNSINEYSEQNEENISPSSNNLIISNLKFGIYKFLLKSSLRPNKYIDREYRVFVVNKDTQLLNLNLLNDNCIYFDSDERVLFTSLIINNNYIFKNNASDALKYLQIYYHEQVFGYTNGSYGYKIQNPSYTIGCDNEYDFNIIENSDKDFVFTKLSSKKKCTSLKFNNGYYKDNIPLTEQKCELKNIYLEDKRSPNYKTKLECSFIESESLSYCNINQRKFINPNIDFDIYFNYGDNYLKSDKQINLYNSINDSDFDISYKEPILSIISQNFDMNRISIVDINNKSYVPNSTPFISKVIDNITFIYYQQNETKSYVTKLTRSDYDKDRDTTIKHKNIYQEIKEMDCPEFQRPYNGECVECQFLARYGIIDKDLKWIQDHKCVAKCDFDNGNGYSIFDSKNYYCKKCAEKTKMTSPEGEDIYVCSCLIGTVKSFENQICYLPEDDEIAKLRNILTRAQCYQAGGDKHNYCSNYSSCNVENKNGYLFPFCYCEEGYTGRYCEFPENNYSLSSQLDEVLSINNDNEIDETNIATIAKIRGITYFFEEEGNKKMEHFKSTTNINDYIKSSLDIIDKVKNFGRNTVAQIFDVMELAIYFLKEKILNSHRLRNLEEENKDRKDLNKILNNLHYLNVKANYNHTGNFKIQTDKLYLATFIVYKKNDLNDASFREEMSDKNYFKIMEYANISETSLDDKIFVTLINSSLFDEEEKINSGDFGVRAYFSTTNDTNGTNTLMDKSNIIFYISSSAIHFNFDLAEYYNSKNIKIYDKNDEAFTDPCFLSKDFDFDLTQKYRKNNVYQKITFGNDVCKYVNFEYEYNKYTRLVFECNNFSYFSNISELQYGMLEFNFKRDSVKDADKVYNLPTKCTSKIDNIGDNWAFWFFLILCLFEIIYCIGLTILNLGSLKRVSYRKGLEHDEFYQIIPFKKKAKPNEEIMSNSEQLAKDYIKATIKKTYVKEEDNQTEVISDIASERALNKSFLDYLKDNFKELHPLATLCRVSLISPLILNSIFFVFNTLILFGFNALLYYESLIEKRIYKPNRNNFDYPMLKEFHKIILSILCQICLCAIAKLILIVTIKQKNDLKDNLRKCYKQDTKSINNGIVIKIDQFQDDIFLRRILSAAFMTIIIVFFFYYSVAFCGVYIQTQRNWFFSGIWSLFWNWIIFAPIYIAVISFLEFKKNDPDDVTIYYLKRLFFF